MNGKPDVVELARAQLDFSALNAAAPSVKQVLFKAQTIVPLPTHPLRRIGKPAAVAAVLCAVLLLPWIPQRTVLSVAELQFDSRFTPSEAQQLVDTALRGLALHQQALLGSEFTPRGDEKGQLTLRASSFSLHGAELLRELQNSLAADGTTPPISYALPGSEAAHAVWRSPAEVLLDNLRPHGAESVPAYYPAAPLALSALSGEAVYRQQLTKYLQQRGYQLTGFSFCGNRALLPAGCQFTLDAWPQPVAVGVRRYFQLTPYQKQDLSDQIGTWLTQMNLRSPALNAAALPDSDHPVICAVRDGQGRIDQLLTARLNALLKQPSAADLADVSYSLDAAVSAAANQALAGLERRVDFERTSALADPPLYKVTLTLLGPRQAGEPAAPDPADNPAVRDQF